MKWSDPQEREDALTLTWGEFRKQYTHRTRNAFYSFRADWKKGLRRDPDSAERDAERPIVLSTTVPATEQAEFPVGSKKGAKKLTIAFGDMHFGDQGLLYDCFLECRQDSVKLAKREKPDEIELDLVGDGASGRGIFRTQELRNILPLAQPQVLWLAWEIKDWFAALCNACPKAVISGKNVLGNHDFAMGENLAYELPIILYLFDIPWKYCGRQTVVNLAAAGETPFLALMEHGYGHCFSPDTEVMTEAGPKGIANVEIGELVYSIAPTTGEVSLQPILAKQTFRWERDLVSIQSQHIDLLVTPNHGLYLDSYDHNAARWQGQVVRRLAGNLPQYRMFRFPILNGWNGCRTEQIIFELNGRTLPMEDWLQFLGWYVSEGYSGKYGPYPRRAATYRVSICQYDPVVRYQILALAKRLGFGAFENRDAIEIADRGLVDWLGQHCGHTSHEKRLPDFVWTLPTKQLRMLFDTLMLGDGDAQGYRYTTASRALRDDVMQLCLRLGKLPRYSQDSGVWRVRVSSNGGHTVQGRSMVKQVTNPFNTVHDITVANNHTLLAGRNGKFQFTSNSSYYANSYAQIRGTWQAVLDADRRNEGHPIQRVIAGHTHWLNIGHYLAPGRFLDTVGGFQRQDRLSLPPTGRPAGFISYMHDGQTMTVRSITPKQGTVDRLTDDQALDLRNGALAFQQLLCVRDYLREKGLVL